MIFQTKILSLHFVKTCTHFTHMCCKLSYAVSRTHQYLLTLLPYGSHRTHHLMMWWSFWLYTGCSKKILTVFIFLQMSDYVAEGDGEWRYDDSTWWRFSSHGALISWIKCVCYRAHLKKVLNLVSLHNISSASVLM